MTRAHAESPPWGSWLDAWDSLHTKFDGTRDSRFDLIVEVLRARLLGRSLVIDIGAGPGTLTRRILERLPRAHVVAIEIDPVLVRIGERALRHYAARARWIHTDFTRTGWETSFLPDRVDAAVSSLALHSLRPEELRRLYRTIAKLLRRDGLFIDSDWLPWGPKNPRFDGFADEVRKLRTRRGSRISRTAFIREQSRWWGQVRAVPELRGLGAEHPAPRSGKRSPPKAVDLDAQLRLLKRAGFGAVDVIWQNLDTRILMAVR